MKITIIRHGTTEGNVEMLYYGSTDIPILPESAARLRERASRGIYPKADKYYTSGMLRAEQSFEAIFGDTEHTALHDMREINLGDFEMRQYEDLKEDSAFIEWITGDNEANRCPNGESGNEVTERSLRALKGVIAEGKDAFIIAHGGVIGGIMSRLFPCPEGRFKYTPGAGEGYVIEFENGEPTGYTELKADDEGA